MECVMASGGWKKALRWLGAAATSLALVACGGGGDGGPTAGGPGTLRVAMTDAPACGYDHVWVTVERVRVHQSTSAADGDGGWAEVVLATPRRIDLLTLTNGVLEELGSTQLAPGTYTQVRLVLASNTSASVEPANAVQPTGGAVIPLDTPSAQQSGLKLQASVEVQSGQTTDLVLDFDACKSVVKAGNSGRYNLKPVVSVVPRVTSSTINGTLGTSLAGATLSAQQNGVGVRSTTADASGNFSLPFLPTGTYTLVITAEGRATGVIDAVPVGAAPTVLPSVPLPTSTMADITGTVTASTGVGTATAVVTDATVRALQTLTGGPTIEVASKPADAVLGTYTLRVPQAAPVKATYVAGGAFTWTTDTAVAGKYTVQAQSTGRTPAEKPADVSTGASAVVNLNF